MLTHSSISLKCKGMLQGRSVVAKALNRNEVNMLPSSAPTRQHMRKNGQTIVIMVILIVIASANRIAVSRNSSTTGSVG